jgi:hypothetical protein
MTTRIGEGRSLGALVLGFMMTAVLLAPAAAVAKDDRDRDRFRFYGWVEFIPEGFHGTWIIGGQQVSTNPRTQFDQFDGPLVVGGCVKVDIRGGFVHEIDSEPPRDCR